MKVMTSTIYWVQVLTLLAGTVFSWMTVALDFTRFYKVEGTLLKVDNCLYPNPVTTACFYGAFAFAAAFVWAIFIARRQVEERKKEEKKLFYLLISGTIFAWSNFGILLYHFYTALPGEGVGCSGVPAATPFATPCFYGSVLFATALVVSIIILVRDSKK